MLTTAGVPSLADRLIILIEAHRETINRMDFGELTFLVKHHACIMASLTQTFKPEDPTGPGADPEAGPASSD